MAESFLSVNAPVVISEVIDGEAVIMHLGSGRYFSCQGTGGEIWSLIEKGTTEDRVVEHMGTRYAVEPEVLSAALSDFLSRLKEHELVREEAGGRAAGDPAGSAPDSTDQAGAAFEPPTLNVYSDMEDLLLLDPIHDVDETGWPQPKPAAPEGPGHVTEAPGAGAPDEVS